MIEPLPISDATRENRRKAVDKIMELQNSCIARAVEDGRNDTCLMVDRYSPYYREVRAVYERAGYRVKPTGYSNGVWQETESLYW